ncbi:MAG: NAD(P)-dependent oxidoreductase, partial [Pseudomonadota bacterium]
MIILDTALKSREAEGRPVRVGMIGAGFMGRGIALQIERYVPGMRLVAIYNRTPSEAHRAFREAGVAGSVDVGNVSALEQLIEKGGYAVSESPEDICRAENIDVVIEVTGA